MEDDCFTMLCQFLPYSHVNQSQVHTYPLSFEPPFFPPRSHPLGPHRALSRARCFIWQLPTSCACYTRCCLCLSSSHPFLPPTLSTIPFSMSVSLRLPCRYTQWYHCFRFHVYALIYDVCFSLSYLLHSV